MILSLLLAAQAGTAVDCSTLSSSIAGRECELAQSLEQVPGADCQEQLTQFDMNVCSYRDFLQTDIELNRRWRRVEQRWKTEKDGREFWQSLLAAQRAWISFRDAECAVWRTIYRGGSIVPLVENTCLTRTTQTRIQELDILLDTPS